MVSYKHILLLAGATLLATSPVHAGDGWASGHEWFVHLGGAGIRQADVGTIEMSGVTIPGGAYRTDPGVTLAVEAGVMLRQGFGVAVSATLPYPAPDIGAGTLAALGTLGTATIGFYTATAQYHVPLRGPIKPYVGAGIGYMHVLSNRDGAITDLAVQSAAGGAVQLGVDIMVSDNVGLFLDVKKLFITTTATGTFMGAPVSSSPRIDPWIISSGISLRF